MAAAAQRELQEETGLSAALNQFVGLYEIIRHDAAGQLTVHYAVACYAGFAPEGEALAASDAKAVSWVAPEEISRLALAPNIADAVQRARLLLKL